METSSKPKNESWESLGGDQSESGETRLDAASEQLMETLLATCLALPRRDVDVAIEEACRTHPHLAEPLRHRYVDLLQMGILEHHEEQQEGHRSCQQEDARQGHKSTGKTNEAAE